MKPGQYEWGVAILDCSKTPNVPGIHIATTRSKTADGWVKLLPVTIE